MQTTQVRRQRMLGYLAALATVAIIVRYVALPGTPMAAPAGKVVIKFAHNQQTITPPHKAAESSSRWWRSAQRLLRRPDLSGQQLGSMRDQVEGTMLGTIDLSSSDGRNLPLCTKSHGR